MKGAQWHHEHPGEAFDIAKLSANDFAFLAIVPATIALAVLVIGDFMIRRRLPQKIGYALRRIPSGVAWGIVGTIIVLPLIWSFGVIVEWAYRRAGIEHPESHELLRVMREAPPHVQRILIIGACVAAPIFEEFLFRGHIQTVLLRLFTMRPLPPLAPLAKVFPYHDPPATMPSTPMLPPPIGPPPLPYQTPQQTATRPRWMAWLAVIITSVMFAAVHDLWMAPLIFLLSLCLGFAYERTGNLWTPIVIHALFNTTSTLFYLKMG